jgi:hypothetical protein
MSLIEREPGAQNYEAWFTEYPSTHRRAGQTVEVVTRAAYERLRHDTTEGAVEALRRIDKLLEVDMQRGPFMARLEEIVADAIAVYGAQ